MKSHFSVSWHSYSVHWQSFLSCEDCFLLGQKFLLGDDRIAVLTINECYSPNPFHLKEIWTCLPEASLYDKPEGSTAVPRPSAPLVIAPSDTASCPLGEAVPFTGDICIFKKEAAACGEENSPVICVSHKCPEVLWETLPWGTENLGWVTLSVASGICHMLGCICLNCGGSCCLFLHDVYIRIFFFTSVNIVVFLFSH